MEYILYYLFITVFIILGINIIYKRKYNKKIQYEIQKEKEKYIEKNKQHLEFLTKRDIEYLLKQRDEVEADLKQKIDYLHSVQDTYAKLNAQIEEQQQRAKNYEADQKARIDENIAVYEQGQRIIVNAKIDAEAQEKQKAAELAFAQTMADMAQRSEAAGALIEQMGKQIEQLQGEIEEYSAKQAAINEAILRQRAIEEQQDFYRICLSNEAKSDINYLISIIPNLKNPTALYKLIWSEYIQKQFNQMLKNVLGATDPRNVIYSITNLKTNEIYIGKTKAEVSKRWTEHVKSSLNIGAIKSAKIHEALYNHWDEFVFSIIEKVPLEENLSNREKFYIDFYQSNIYGYNLKSGG